MRMPEMPLRERANEIYDRTYHNEVGVLNRKQRRTVRGRMLVVEAENKALRAKLEFLEQENKEK